MSKSKVFPIIVLMLALVALPILAVYRSSNPDQALTAGPEEFEAEESAEFDYEQAADNMAYRWQAMAEGYKRLGLLNYADNPDDVIAFRWRAMADGYERLGLLNDDMDPGDVSAFRWLAIARGYESLGLLNEK
jgi:hypothetical protein